MLSGVSGRENFALKGLERKKALLESKKNYMDKRLIKTSVKACQPSLPHDRCVKPRLAPGQKVRQCHFYLTLEDADDNFFVTHPDCGRPESCSTRVLLGACYCVACPTSLQRGGWSS